VNVPEIDGMVLAHTLCTEAINCPFRFTMWGLNSPSGIVHQLFRSFHHGASPAS